MVLPTPPPEPVQTGIATAPDPSLAGPYDAPTNGTCAAGHPLNGEGRCDPLNTTGHDNLAAPL